MDPKCEFCATVGKFNCTDRKQADACISRRYATVSIQKWITSGGIAVSTDTLEHNHPMHPYNQLLTQKVVPEHYGVTHPLEDEFKEISRGELIKEIMKLRKELRTGIDNAYTD